MKRHSSHAGLQAAALTVLAGWAVLFLSGHGGRSAYARPFSPAVPAAAECEGDACTQVTLAYDESKGEYRVQNNSTNQWARVSASNAAASASVCLAPGKSDSLPLKSVVGHYRAEYAEPRCGAPPV